MYEHYGREIEKSVFSEVIIESWLCVCRKDSGQDVNKAVPSRERSAMKPSLLRDEATISQLTERIEHFDHMNLREPLLRGIYGYGIERPSDIQQRAVKPCISGSFPDIS